MLIYTNVPTLNQTITNPGIGITNTMKTTRQIMNILLLSLLTTATVINAQATGTEPGDSVTNERSFEVGMSMGPDWKINLRLGINQAKRIIITVKDANNTVLYREHLKKGPASYWWKFDFKDSEPGVYQFEIRDGQQTIRRQVEVVNVPAVDQQRYITYGPQTSL